MKVQIFFANFDFRISPIVLLTCQHFLDLETYKGTKNIWLVFQNRQFHLSGCIRLCKYKRTDTVNISLWNQGITKYKTFRETYQEFIFAKISHYMGAKVILGVKIQTFINFFRNKDFFFKFPGRAKASLVLFMNALLGPSENTVRPSAQPAPCFWNMESLKVLNNTKLIIHLDI